MMSRRRLCTHCGGMHDVLATLNPECLAAYVPATDEEIRSALEKGRKARIAFESLPLPGRYR